MPEESTSTPKKEPTASEAMFFFAIVKHTRNKADIDWNAVAMEQGFKNADVAKVRFGQVKRKLGISTDTGSSTRSPAKKGASNATEASPKVKKNAGRAGAKAGAGRGRGKVKKEEPVEYMDNADDDETVKAEPMDPAAQFEADMNVFDDEDPF